MPRTQKINAVGAKAKTEMMTSREMRQKAAPGLITSMRRAAAYIRGIAKRMVRRSNKPSRPGTPPHTRHGQLKRSIFYAVEGRGVNQQALIGPTFTGVGRIMLAHEYGQRYKGRDYPDRPLMNPALGKARDRLPSFWRGSIHD